MRVPGKNIRPLGPHPLIAYTIAAATQCGVFDAVVVSTDDEEIAAVAKRYGAEVPFLRPAEIAGPVSPDIEWVRHALDALKSDGREFDYFSILRPTSPFRQASTIQRAWKEFTSEGGVDSLRAVQLCREHPGKMWIVRGRRMEPLLPIGQLGQPWHSSQYQSLPPVYVQNASLEIAWTRVVAEGTIAGVVVVPFMTEGFEGFDINDEHDWARAEELVRQGTARLPEIG